MIPALFFTMIALIYLGIGSGEWRMVRYAFFGGGGLITFILVRRDVRAGFRP